VGQRVSRPVNSRLEFSVYNENRTFLLRKSAAERAENIYKLDDSLLEDVRGRLANAMKAFADLPGDLTAASANAAGLKINLSESALEEVRRRIDAQSFGQYEEWADQTAQNLRRTPLVETGEAVAPRTALYAILRDQQNEFGRREPVSQLIAADSVDATKAAIVAAVQPYPEPLRPSIAESILRMMTNESGKVRPLYRYLAQASLEASQLQEASIEKQFDQFPIGATLADIGPISPSELASLNAEHEAYKNSRVEMTARAVAIIGQAFLAVAIVVGFALYLLALRSFRKLGTKHDWVRLAILLSAIAASRLVFITTGNESYSLGAQVFAVALIAVLGPRGIQTPIAGVLAMLITLATSTSLDHFLLLIFVSGVVVIGLREVRNRGKIVVVGLLASLVALLVSFATGQLDGQTFIFVLRTHALPAAAATLAAAFVVEGILPGFERLLKISTSMTLLEWCDANKPLMRMMAGEAPGTYNHSLLVGSLAETAAESVGANGLLCRAGAYYHDIGKTRKPEYFVENQQLGISPHEKLTPAMSHLVIINHVKNGIEMAKEYGVPEVLHPFIAEHHGTTIVEYFYHAASKARKADEPEVADTSFRYPGPKPQSRETAILMLCDAVEGAVRAMTEPTPARIEEIVTTIAQKRLIDGQFDECELTFKDLARVEKAIVKALNGIYHARIVYPESGEKDAKIDAKGTLSDTGKIELTGTAAKNGSSKKVESTRPSETTAPSS
ncbi:MAG: HD family phosphohydrolase, partial [Phycisphaerae bacterium]